MSESSSSRDEKDIAEEENQDVEVFTTKSDQNEPLAGSCLKVHTSVHE